jgi:hypothetical protein
MTDMLNSNKDAFAYAWNRLMAAGFEAVSPHFLESVLDMETRQKMGPAQVYRYALPIDTFALSSCDFMMVLPGWEDSDGTGFELHGAKLFDIPVIEGRGHHHGELTLEQWMDRVIVNLRLNTEATCETTPS